MSEELAPKGTSRGEFLVNSAGVAGLVVGAGVWTRQARADDTPADVEELAAAAAVGARGFATTNFALELDGVLIGMLKKSEGGASVAEIVIEKVQDYFPKKHLANFKYDDFTLQIGFTMNKVVYDWINASWTGQAQHKNGAIHAGDAHQDEKSKRSFQSALITETTIPACDGSSKDAGYIELSFAPDSALTSPSSGKLPSVSGKQKQWLASNFRLEIDGLDCTKVSKIDAFTIKQSFVTNPIGEQRDFQREPGKLEFPNLRVTLAAISGQTWATFFESFVLQGNSGDDKEKNGTLTFLDGNRTTELGKINFFNLGIFKLSDDTTSADRGDAIRRLVAELYCERMELHIPPGSGGIT